MARSILTNQTVHQAIPHMSPPVREPVFSSELPKHPWQKVATDLFELNRQSYLLVVDYYSRYPEVTKLRSTTSAAIISALKTIFS